MNRNLGIQYWYPGYLYIREYSGAFCKGVAALFRFVRIQVSVATWPSASRVWALQCGPCKRPCRRPSIQTDDASVRVSPCYHCLLLSVPIQASESPPTGGRIVRDNAAASPVLN